MYHGVSSQINLEFMSVLNVHSLPKTQYAFSSLLNAHAIVPKQYVLINILCQILFDKGHIIRSLIQLEVELGM